MDVIPHPNLAETALLDDLIGNFRIGSETERRVDGTDLSMFEVLDPATARPIASVRNATLADAQLAVRAAGEAFADWSRAAPQRRAEMIRRVAMLIQQQKDGFARLITLEMGKLLSNSIREVDLALEYLYWFAEEALRVHGTSGLSPDGSSTAFTLRKPLGIALLITPWNFPLVTIVRKLGACLVAGCSAIIKPSEETPLTALALAKVLAEAEAPHGLVNVLPTAHPAPLISQLMSAPLVRKLSFTGSFPVGRLLQEQAAGNMLRTSMELGGNAPFIVFADADIELAVEHAVAAKLAATGQVCTAPNRFLVERTIYAEFCEKLAQRFKGIRVGPGAAPSSSMGPVISEKARARILGMVRDAIERGGRLIAGSDQPPVGDGFFLEPTVIVDVPISSALWRDEIFGPVAQIAAFDSEVQALELARHPAGLAGYLYTRDFDRALRFGELLQVGMLGVNRIAIVNAGTPFGGIGQAGFGVEGGRDALGEYLSTSYVAFNRLAQIS